MKRWLNKKVVYRKNYPSLDIAKFIFAIIVIAIHTKPLLDISEKCSLIVNNSIFSIAVPFFFITSGFLLFSKYFYYEKQAERAYMIKKYVLHILRMYLVWTIIWLPLKILNFFTTEGGGFNFISVLVYIKDIVLVSSGDALWYLLSLIYSVIFIWLLNKKLKMSIILFIGTILYIIGMFITNWCELLPKTVADIYFKLFYSTDNAVFCGIFYVALGGTFAEINIAERIKGKRIRLFLLFLFITTIVLSCFEADLLIIWGMNQKDEVVLLMSPVASSLIFILIITSNIKFHKIFYLVRFCSVLMYLSHCVFIRLFKMAEAILKFSVPNALLFLIIFCLSLLFSCVVHFTDKDKKTILKYLY